MKRPFSLATRAFLLSCLSMRAVLAAGFFALNAAINRRIEEMSPCGAMPKDCGGFL